MPFISKGMVLRLKKVRLYCTKFLCHLGIRAFGRGSVEGIVLSNGRVGYKDIPKTACTSIKLTLFQLESKKKYIDGENEDLNIHQYMERKASRLDDCQFRFIIIRDPIKRFLSAYSNRVVHHKELSKEYLEQEVPHLIKEVPCFNPSLDVFINNFDKYWRVPTIQHHFRPISQFINFHSLNYFSHVYPIEKLKDLEDELSKLYSSEVKFPRLQTGGPKIKTSDLTSSQLDVIREIYFDDYVLVRNYYE